MLLSKLFSRRWRAGFPLRRWARHWSLGTRAAGGISLRSSRPEGGWSACQIEPLEQRKVLDADFSFTSPFLTITLDDANQEISFVSLSSTGDYRLELSGAASNVFVGTDGSGISGNGTSALTVANGSITSIRIEQNAAVAGTRVNLLDSGANKSVAAVSVSLNASSSEVVQSGRLVIDGPLTLQGISGISLGGSISTAGDQNYAAPVTLTAAASLNAAPFNGTPGDILFAGTLDGGYDLAVNATGMTRFDGAVGGGTPLTSLDATADNSTVVAADVTTTGIQSYGPNLTFPIAVSLVGGQFDAQGFFASGQDIELSFTDAVALDAGLTVTSTANLTLAGPATLNGSFDASGIQQLLFRDEATLVANATLTGVDRKSVV